MPHSPTIIGRAFGGLVMAPRKKIAACLVMLLFVVFTVVILTSASGISSSSSSSNRCSPLLDINKDISNKQWSRLSSVVVMPASARRRRRGDATPALTACQTPSVASTSRGRWRDDDARNTLVWGVSKTQCTVLSTLGHPNGGG
ncbi:unnamed protein product [Chrysodeixis includens]|uniref:Uncharacterized protein n=1 Tax=Chrysodeixis includens TaxID=689277 RepID=A0A9N8KXR4_CHRIL|nr:unnamed protein product [Chrysodeixis includens]